VKFLQSLLILLFLSCSAFAADETPITKVRLPLEVTTEMHNASNIPKDIEGLEWNRWTSKNFTVLSLNNTQAEFLHKHLEQIKTWMLARWGFYDIDFSTECKMICVDDPALFEKLFKLTSSRVEVRRTPEGKIKETVVFLLINGSPSHTVPVPLTEVVMAEFQQKYNANFGWWSDRGIAVLNGSLGQIREELKDLKPRLEGNQPMYFSEGLLTMSRDQYASLSEANKRLFDQSAFCLCLMIRKEFGQDTFHQFLKTASDKSGLDALKEVLKFNDYEQFDRTFKRYMLDLTRDVLSGKTPDHYLQINGKDTKLSSSVFSSSS